MVKIEKLQSFAWNGTMGFGFDNKPFVQHEYERQETKNGIQKIEKEHKYLAGEARVQDGRAV